MVRNSFPEAARVQRAAALMGGRAPDGGVVVGDGLGPERRGMYCTESSR